MTLTIDLPPDVEARLHVQAQARGKLIEDYLRDILEELIVTTEQIPGEPTPEQLEQMLDELAEGGEKLPNLPTEAFSRANIYSDHD